MARVLAAQGQAISALALHDRAIALRNELLNNPELWAEQRRLIRGLSIVLASSAESSVLLMKFDRATEHINRAIRNRSEKVLAKSPLHVETRWMLADHLRLKGMIELQAGRGKDAVLLLRDAVARFRTDFQEDTELSRNIRSLVVGLGGLVTALEASGSFHEALVTVREGVVLAAQADERNATSMATRNDLHRMRQIQSCLEQQTITAVRLCSLVWMPLNKIRQDAGNVVTKHSVSFR